MNSIAQQSTQEKQRNARKALRWACAFILVFDRGCLLLDPLIVSSIANLSDLMHFLSRVLLIAVCLLSTKNLLLSPHLIVAFVSPLLLYWKMCTCIQKSTMMCNSNLSCIDNISNNNWIILIIVTILCQIHLDLSCGDDFDIARIHTERKWIRLHNTSTAIDWEWLPAMLVNYSLIASRFPW